MANRMIHLDFTFDQATWLDGFVAGFDTVNQPSMTDLVGHGDDRHRAQMRGAVTAFLRARPGDFDAAYLLLAGAVGEGPAREYLTFQRELDLPTPEEVLARHTTINWAAFRPDKAFAIAGALRAYVLNGTVDKATWLGAVNALSSVAEAGLPEVAQGAVAALLNSRPETWRSPRRVGAAFADLFVGIGRWAA